MVDTDTFYETVPVIEEFGVLASGAFYHPIPDDWILGVADIVNSTKLIEAGQYKTVNTVGAAVISALINAFPAKRFPYVFGGDGASFSAPADCSKNAAHALDAVRRWAKQEFDLDLRTALMRVSDIRQAGLQLNVARFAPSANVDFAMFSGGGMRWAEQEMKSGRFHVPELAETNLPNLEGLSCRWTPMTSQNGLIMSVVAVPRDSADPLKIQQVIERVLSLADGLDRAGHPVMANGPEFKWPPAGLELEARSGDADKPLWRRKLKLYVETFVALIFFKTKWNVGGFDPAHYVKTSGLNSDFRKFEDALMMTLDCDEKSRDAIITALKDGEHDGLINFGVSEQTEALMTCIVPSIMSDDHVHFIDGAAGGYTMAATSIKEAKASAAKMT